MSPNTSNELNELGESASPGRSELLDRLRANQTWDVLIIGGGATGLGCAVDAAARGYRTLLLERGDYACGTSSRSTKLIHGGVRYWDAQFDDARLAIALMRTATDLGATCLNHLPVSGLKKTAGRVQGATAHDAETGELFQLRARVVINATGVYADRVR
ncbi:MAG: glycerol-3-phosphate dehydrogenase, partial [Pseudomonadota bacterium]|nr:glycerol-3-phosphate dehydrogenase [Pseudomonadota bacterium]